jgi:hypothetical protein
LTRSSSVRASVSWSSSSRAFSQPRASTLPPPIVPQMSPSRPTRAFAPISCGMLQRDAFLVQANRLLQKLDLVCAHPRAHPGRVVAAGRRTV